MNQPQLPLAFHLQTVAVVLAADGSLYDEAFNVDTGLTYAAQGYTVVAVAPSSYPTIEDCQAAYDSVLVAYEDRFSALDLATAA